MYPCEWVNVTVLRYRYYGSTTPYELLLATFKSAHRRYGTRVVVVLVVRRETSHAVDTVMDETTNVSLHAEGGHYCTWLEPPKNYQTAAAIALAEGQNGMGTPLVNGDGSLMTEEPDFQQMYIFNFH